MIPLLGGEKNKSLSINRHHNSKGRNPQKLEYKSILSGDKVKKQKLWRKLILKRK